MVYFTFCTELPGWKRLLPKELHRKNDLILIINLTSAPYQ